MSYSPLDNISLADAIGRPSFNSSFGESITAHRLSHINSHFYYNINAQDFTTTVTNSGTVTAANSMANISSGTTTNSTSKLQSTDYIVYEAGKEIFAMMTAMFNAPVTNTSQKIGPYDIYDGFWFGINTSNQFCISRRNNQTDNVVIQSNFNLDKLDGTGTSGFTLDVTKVNLYMVCFGWLGIAPITFWVNAGYTKGWVPFHYIDLVNTSTTPTIQVPVLPITAEVNNGSTQSNISLKTICWNGGILKESGDQNPSIRVFSQEALKTISSNINTNIITIKNNLTYDGRPSKILMSLRSLGYTTDTGGNTNNRAVKIYLYKNATINGTPQFTSVDSESTCSYDTAGTTFSSGKLLTCIGSTTNWGAFNEFTYPIKLKPGESISDVLIAHHL